jgi:hypothetical protein
VSSFGDCVLPTSPGIAGARLAGRFVVTRRLGHGGMSVVFEAFDEQTIVQPDRFTTMLAPGFPD